MKTVNLPQGSDAWLAHRRTTRNASDAPAMMGASPYVTRSELLRQKATGIEREVSAETQKVFDRGHAVEPALRARAEHMIGEDLYPVTGVSDDGYLGASFDGVNLEETIILEAKQTNAGKMELVDRGEIPPGDFWQIVHQFAVCSTAHLCLYMVGDGTEDTAVLQIQRAGIEDSIARLLAGWKQFDADVAAYVPADAPAPAAVGTAPDKLPALRIELTGMVKASNLAEFKQQAFAQLETINRDLKTDEDFATATEVVKWCGDTEDMLEAAKNHALSQTADIDELFRTIDAVAAKTRAIRLELNKLVSTEKDKRKAQIVDAGRASVVEHYRATNVGLGIHSMQFPASLASELGAAIKGLRTLKSITDAVDTAATSAKIAASQKADAIRANVEAMKEFADHATLFPDLVALCAAKTPDDLRNLAKQRIADHEAAEADRKARSQAAESVTYNRAVEPSPPPSTQKVASPATREVEPTAEPVKLGDINARIAPLSISAEGLASLGFSPVSTKGASKLYSAKDFRAICESIIALVTKAANQK